MLVQNILHMQLIIELLIQSVAVHCLLATTYTYFDSVGHSSAADGGPQEDTQEDHATASQPFVHTLTGLCFQEEVWSMAARAASSQAEVTMNGGAAQLAPSLSEVQLVEAFFDVEQQLSIAAAGAAHPAALPQVLAYAYAHLSEPPA